MIQASKSSLSKAEATACVPCRSTLLKKFSRHPFYAFFSSLDNGENVSKKIDLNRINIFVFFLLLEPPTVRSTRVFIARSLRSSPVSKSYSNLGFKNNIENKQIVNILNHQLLEAALCLHLNLEPVYTSILSHYSLKTLYLTCFI